MPRRQDTYEVVTKLAAWSPAVTCDVLNHNRVSLDGGHLYGHSCHVTLDTESSSVYSQEHRKVDTKRRSGGSSRPVPHRFEVYMLVKDRRRLARLIEIQGVSRRQVAQAAGWKSHTYLLRLLSGQARTLEPEHAVKIAAFLRVDLYDLFMPKVSSDSRHDVKNGRTAA